MQERRLLKQRAFEERDTLSKAERLFREFDTIGDQDNAEKQMLILCNTKNPSTGRVENEQEYWL
jgi:hypothetical protein